MSSTNTPAPTSSLFVRQPSRFFVYEDDTGCLVRLAYQLLIPTDPAKQQAVPLLLEAGGGQRKEFWMGVDDLLAADRPLILKDHRGEGGVLDDGKAVNHDVTDYQLTLEQKVKHGIELSDNLSPKNLAYDSVALASFLYPQHKKVHYGGLSLGSIVTQSIGIYYPERVASLVLLSTSPNPQIYSQDNTNVWKGVFPGRLPAAGVYTPEQEIIRSEHAKRQDEAIGFCLNPQWMSTPENQKTLQSMLSMVVTYPTSFHSVIQEWSVLAHQDFSSLVDSSHLLVSDRVPVLLIHGEADDCFPVSGMQVFEKILPQAQVVILPNVNHILMLEVPQELAKHMSSFLQNIASPMI